MSSGEEEDSKKKLLSESKDKFQKKMTGFVDKMGATVNKENIKLGILQLPDVWPSRWFLFYKNLCFLGAPFV